MQLLPSDADACCFARCAREQVFHVAEAFFAQELFVTTCDEAAFSLHRLDKTLCFQVCVCALGSDGADAQVVGECADGRELRALFELARKNEVFQLAGNLLVDGRVA